MLAISLGSCHLVRADGVLDIVAGEMSRQRIPGLALAVVRRGVPLRTESFGLANLELDVPVRPETVFQTGSIGKQLTAAAVLLLVEDGKLALDDRLSKHLPGAPEHWRQITVRQLLTHTAGVRDYGPPEVELRSEYTEEDLARIIMTPPLEFAPGTNWSYSNAGYVVLGALIRGLTGEHWSAFVARRLFAPASMSSARLISEADIVPHRAAGYRLEHGTVKNQEWVSPSLNTTADGALYASVVDLAKWDAALSEASLLSAQSRQWMWEPVRLANGRRAPYGFGWSVIDQRGRPTLEHSGHWQGFSAHIARYPEQGMSVIVMCNLAFAEVRRIAHDVAGSLIPELALPDPSQIAADPRPGREQGFRATLQAWAESTPLPYMVPGVEMPTLPPPGEALARKRTQDRERNMTGFGWLASDAVPRGAISRNGVEIGEIAHYGMVTPAAAYRYHFYLDTDGRIADFVAEEW